MTPVWPTIERFLAEHGSAVLVTLAESAGSSPREVGARMVVTLERFEGRDLDKVVPLATAERSGRFLTVSEPGQPMRRSLATGSPGGPGYAKLPDGRIAERFGPSATPLYLFGAGHVGQSL